MRYITLLLAALLSAPAFSTEFCVQVDPGTDDYVACPGYPEDWRAHLPSGVGFGQQNCTGLLTSAEKCTWNDTSVIPVKAVTINELAQLTDKLLASLFLPYGDQRMQARVQLAPAAQMPDDFNAADKPSGPISTAPASTSMRFLNNWGGSAVTSAAWQSANAASGGIQSYAASSDNYAWQLPANASISDAVNRVNELMSCESRGVCQGTMTRAQYSAAFKTWQSQGRPGLTTGASATVSSAGGYAFATVSRGGVTFTVTNIFKSCDGGVLDVTAGTCATQLQDGKCDYFIDSSGKWSTNPFDPDFQYCNQFIKVDNTLSGKSTVTVHDPITGSTTDFDKPTPAGPPTITDYQPDPITQTTKEREITPSIPVYQNPPSISEESKPGLIGGNGSKDISAIPNVVSTPGAGTSETVSKGVRDGMKSDRPVSLGDDLQAGVDSEISSVNNSDGLFQRFKNFGLFKPTAPLSSCSEAFDLGDAGRTVLDFGTIGGHEQMGVDFNLAEVCPLVTPYEDYIRNIALSLWYFAAVFLLIRWTI